MEFSRFDVELLLDAVDARLSAGEVREGLRVYSVILGEGPPAPVGSLQRSIATTGLIVTDDGRRRFDFDSRVSRQFRENC